MAIPQTNRTGVSTTLDVCLTPPEAVQLLIPYLESSGVKTIWECASGIEQRYIVDTLLESGFNVVGTDVRYPPSDPHHLDFLRYAAPAWLDSVDCIVTNPPFSLDYQFLARCKQLGLPWALLMKDDREGVARCASSLFNGSGLPLYKKLVPSSRIAYCMPQKGWESSPQFSTCWYTFGLNLPDTIVHLSYSQPKRENEESFVPYVPAVQLALF